MHSRVKSKNMADEEQKDAMTVTDASKPAVAEETVPLAKSLKCVDCGKLFKNIDLANYHAEKSGHENFEESTEEVAVHTCAANCR